MEKKEKPKRRPQEYRQRYAEVVRKLLVTHRHSKDSIIRLSRLQAGETVYLCYDGTLTTIMSRAARFATELQADRLAKACGYHVIHEEG